MTNRVLMPNKNITVEVSGVGKFLLIGDAELEEVRDNPEYPPRYRLKVEGAVLPVANTDGTTAIYVVASGACPADGA